MVSEGVDIPRLIVATYATAKRTDLFFRQAVGRVVRPHFIAADEALTGRGERVEVELRQHVRDGMTPV